MKVFAACITCMREASEKLCSTGTSTSVRFLYAEMDDRIKAQDYFNKVKTVSPLSFESKMAPKDYSSLKISSACVPPRTEEVDIVKAGDFYYVQVGYFKTRENAEKLTKKLTQNGYDSYIANEVKAGLMFYRVKVGRFKSKSEADKTALKLKSDGYKTRVCR